MIRTMMLEPNWKEQSIDRETDEPLYTRHIVMLCEPGEELYERISGSVNGITYIRLQSETSGIEKRFEAYALKVFEEIQLFIRSKPHGKILIQIVAENQGEQHLFSGLTGLLRTARLENPKLIGQMIEVEAGEDAMGLIRKLTENKQSPGDSHIRYDEGKRYVPGWSEIDRVQKQEVPWRDGGVYLITGGAGGLGLIFAQEIAEKAKNPILILTGRSLLSEEKQKKLKELQVTGASVEYKQMDITDNNAVIELIENLGKDFGNLHGIFHSAGVILDSFILKKRIEEVREVLAPKVAGLKYLDDASKDMNLDFFILFSSVSGAIGNPGQADYATANAFMDAYAKYRNEKVLIHQRQGQTLSINWPLWKEGGMHVDEETEKMMIQKMGIVPIGKEKGVELLYRALAQSNHQVMVLQGDAHKFNGYFLNDSKQVNSEVLKEKTLSKLKALLGEEIKLSVDQIDVFEELDNYGIDSIFIMNLNQKIEDIFGECSKTIFYEYQTLNELTDYFIQNYLDSCIEWTQLNEQFKTITGQQATDHTVKKETFDFVPHRKRNKPSRSFGQKSRGKGNLEPIAIIGISGRYPQANNLQEYWSNLEKGKDCIVEIPEERWSLEGFYDPDRKESFSRGKSYSKWGGFVDGFANFDPLFFNISPREAMNMDPQERLFIQSCWEALEDAGYTKEQLATHHKGRVGVYAGITKTGFGLYGPELWNQNERLYPHTSFSSVANRVSYLLNLKGPSMPIDTMCSSSLTAIHEACQHLRHGECEMAIVGGVNLYLHPYNYVELCGAQMLSIDGKCKSFGTGANGFVPGEGVGVFILKPLSQALADEDHIDAVITGTHINHGGKTNGYTVPSPVAQGELIREAINKAGINARSISYIEAHGTGTELGDPIEITGLNQAFRVDTKESSFCAIGSIKSNIGHLEAAAGIAGLTKIVLQMKHQKIVPSLHSKDLNSNIQFSKTPFVVQQELTEWKRPVLEIYGTTKEYPRIAGISSFGAGGANAHVLVEEYMPKDEVRPALAVTPENPVVVVLSAKNEERLKVKVEQWVTAIEEQGYKDEQLADIAYTLQVGREAMEERLGVIVGSVQELKAKLKEWLHNPRGVEAVYRGQVKRNKEALIAFVIDEDMQEALEKWIEKRKYSKLLDLWVKGLSLDWNKLYVESKPRRMSLPTYPFAKEQYWVPQVEAKPAGSGITIASPAAHLHPLLHQNTSDLEEQRYSTILTGEEFFLTDHRVNGRKVLPGVAYLEMARAAVEKAARISGGEQVNIQLMNVVWTRPISVEEEPIEVHIGLYPEDNGEISYEIYGEDEASGETLVYSQGRACLREDLEMQSIDVSALQVECSERMLTSSTCYEAFRAMGLAYGEAHQGIECIYVGADQVLAKLSLPSCLADTQGQYVLHPSLMDSALQACIGLMVEEGLKSKPVLPFALQELEVFSHCTGTMWARIRYSEGSKAGGRVQKLDVDVCDVLGKVCVRMKGFTSRVLEGDIGVADSSSAMMMLEPNWKEQSIDRETAGPVYTRHIVMLCEPKEELYEHISGSMNGITYIRLQSETSSIEKRFQAYALQVFEEIQSIIRSKPHGSILIQIVAEGQGEQQLFSGLTGLLRTGRLENPKLIGQMIEVETDEDATGLIQKLTENKQSPGDSHIRYAEGKRWVAGWGEIEAGQEQKLPWRDGGVYLITGGAGGLGLIFAQEIAEKAKNPTLILTGRSVLSEGKQKKLKELQARGAIVEYKQVDVTNNNAVIELMESLREDFGSIHGIIHSAGVIQDSFILKKQIEKVREVLSPKVAGLIYLDEASKEMSLDFFILFSSVSGAIGNPGQADYATANAFMDAYAKYRNEKVLAHQRQGQTLSINWPLWKEGGMHVDAETEKMMMQNTGMVPMNTTTGINILYKGIASGKHQIMGTQGQATRMKDKLLTKKQTNVATSKRETFASEIDTGSLMDKVQAALVQMVSGMLKVKTQDVETDVELNEYGFDSITLTEFANKLNQAFKLELTPTIFFEYSTLQEVACYLTKDHQDVLATQFSVSKRAEAQVYVAKIQKEVEPEIQYSERRRSRFAIAVGSADHKEEAIVLESIAIVGMSGKFPMADNVDELWKNLVAGIDCITEIPKERWDWREYYGNPTHEENKTNIKWGGFIDGVGEFDPMFFGISPREAELMDPQQRLLMTYVWKAIEDAGYSAQSLSGTRMGMFIGTGSSGYSELIAKANVTIEGYSATGKVPSVGPNRMSFFLNIHGPSEPIETACSSSLVAVHRAVNAIRNGECNSAIVGGVNTIVTPEEYISFNKAGMLSEDGRCKTFTAKANGYVRGEGVGMIFLKRLSDAEDAGDHIYGVIKGTDENHGGRSNSLTAPNPKAQAELLKVALTKAQIDPRTVSYMEVHGTGTQLGDPIEINGLKMAFKELTQTGGEKGRSLAYCGLGSVKTNIGHLELASGIAGLIKTLLQMKHKMLIKNLHFDNINPYIDLKDSPFYIVQETQEWKPLKNADGRELPRRAGVSSFGFGGANAHVVIEEYMPKDEVRSALTVTPENPVVIVLSAKNEERLKEQVQQWIRAIEEQGYTDEQLADIAYTLQVGREAMEDRLGVIVGSVHELEKKLKEWLHNPEGVEEVYRGQVTRNKEALIAFVIDEDMQEAIEKWIEKRKYSKLLDLWVKGLSLDWNKLYVESKPRRMSLPTYPFAKEQYWVPQMEAKPAGSGITIASPVLRLHPLLHQNTSDFTEQRYSTILTGEEFFLTDHRVNGRKVLPGVVYLEMARAAVEKAVRISGGEQVNIQLMNVVWTRPISVEEEPIEVHIGLYPEDNGEISYEIYGEDEASGETLVYSQGRACLREDLEMQSIDVSALQVECSERMLTSSTCYEAFRAMGLAYGEAHQGIECIYVGADQVLAKLSLPSCLADTQEQYVLHPSLMDSALQASIGLAVRRQTGSQDFCKLALPFALEELEVHRPCTVNMWAWVRYSDGRRSEDKVQKLDIDVCDETGIVCVRMKGFTTREWDKVSAINLSSEPPLPIFVTEPSIDASVETIRLTPVWEPCFYDKEVEFPSTSNSLVIIGGNEERWCEVRQHYPNAQVLNIQPENTIEEITRELEEYGRVDHVVWVAPEYSKKSLTEDRIIEGQNEGVLHIFRIIKGLLQLGYGSRKLGWTVVTIQAQPIHKHDEIDPTHASIHGLIGSMTKEYMNWNIRLIDLEANVEWPLATIFNLPIDSQGNPFVYREREWYQQELIPVKVNQLDQTMYKVGGVYVVIGGAGGIGEVWSEYMIRTYQAKIIWIGRRKMDSAIQDKIDRLAEIGSAPSYIAADASDPKDLYRAYQETKGHYAQIQGVIHSAIVLSDRSLANMEEQEFRAVLTAKIDVSVSIAQVFQNERLDFVMFFSSFNAFTKSPGQSNYVSGCIFKDAFAHQLSLEWPCVVKVINWGYWGSVGIVATDNYQKQMEKIGMHSIEPSEAMETLEVLLAGQMDQIALINTTTPLDIQGVNWEEIITI